jgi:hypothetical protein
MEKWSFRRYPGGPGFAGRWGADECGGQGAAMNIGMLWFDNDPRASLDIKIQSAAEYYRNKYGRVPDICFVHPSMLPHATDQRIIIEGGMEVKTSKQLLINHLWIGCEQ